MWQKKGAVPACFPTRGFLILPNPHAVLSAEHVMKEKKVCASGSVCLGNCPNTNLVLSAMGHTAYLAATLYPSASLGLIHHGLAKLPLLAQNSLPELPML